MGKSREFDTILNECLARLLVEGETIEQCLERFPQHRDELKPLLETALATKKASVILPRPEFRVRARYQFHLALQEAGRKRTRSLLSWQPRWAAVIAIVLVLLLAGSGTVAAASNSMPDEFLYPVKLATEQARLVLTPSALGKAEFYARLADRRVTEIAYLTGKRRPEKIDQIAWRLDAHLAKLADLASTGRPKGRLMTAPAAEKASELAAKTGDSTGLAGKDHRTRLRDTVMLYASNHPARLRALLPTAPEVVKPALLRAIAVSEAG